MTSYKTIFDQLNRAALIPFFVLGDPDEKTSLELIKTAIDAGADILELGIPFSDPIADGPTIQKADIRALQAGMTPKKALDLVAQITACKSIPIGLLVYYNLIYHYGVEQFFKDFKRAGGTSVLVADISIDDADEIAPAALSAGLETVFMVTPNTPDQRLKQIADKTTGFIYTVSLLGTTGQRNALSGAVKPLVAKLKALTDKPVCVGFGISSAQHAAEVASAGADGVIIGSRVVKIIEDNLGNPETMKHQVAEFIASVHTALKKA
ncbi:MAG TPA: tryptophan synthase subunit alpha [Anaerohalosphaeraceae bacterium]|nr:tryptophan synthase subunit alpha [Anaerohalosphaeraceae bacterium]